MKCPHGLKRGYQVDGVIQAVGYQKRYILLWYCLKCKIKWAYDLTYEKPDESKDRQSGQGVLAVHKDA